MAQLDMKNATVFFQDGAENKIEITLGEGNVTYTERVNREYTLNRGVLDEVRNGDQAPVEISMTLIWEFYEGTGSGTESPTPIDALKQKNRAAGWTSTDADSCRPYAIDILIDYDPDCGADGYREILLFQDFRYEEINGDLSAATLAVTGKCNVTEIISTRLNASSATL